MRTVFFNPERFGLRRGAEDGANAKFTKRRRRRRRLWLTDVWRERVCETYARITRRNDDDYYYYYYYWSTIAVSGCGRRRRWRRRRPRRQQQPATTAAASNKLLLLHARTHTHTRARARRERTQLTSTRTQAQIYTSTRAASERARAHTNTKYTHTYYVGTRTHGHFPRVIWSLLIERWPRWPDRCCCHRRVHPVLDNGAAVNNEIARHLSAVSVCPVEWSSWRGGVCTGSPGCIGVCVYARRRHDVTCVRYGARWNGKERCTGRKIGKQYTTNICREPFEMILISFFMRLQVYI